MEDNDVILKKEIEIKSDKNKVYFLKLNFSSELEINIKELNKYPEENFKGNFNIEYIMKNKYFSLCENNQDIKDTLDPILKDVNNLILKEEHEELKLILKLPHPKCKEIIFILEKAKKDTKDSIKELYELIDKLNIKISSQENEIIYLKEKLTLQENEINKLKNILDLDFKEIENSWSNEKFKYDNYQNFFYTLKNNDYLAEKTSEDDYMHLIKSKNQFKSGKVYKLEFTVNYINGNNFHIGFGDFNKATSYSWLKNFQYCVGLTEEGLYIEKCLINIIKINNNDKIYTFIIDIDDQKFTLYVNKSKVGEFNFNFKENIFALAGIRKVGNSVSIKTYEKNKLKI